jgi:hypothetical protein
MTESVQMRYSNGKYIREAEYKKSKTFREPEHTWTTKRDIPCGLLRLVVYSVHAGVSWSISFQETTTRSLAKEIPKIVRAVEDSVDPLLKQIAEAEVQAESRRREQEAKHARWLIEEDQREIARSIKESREELERVIKAWWASVSIEQFFKSVEERTGALSEERKATVSKRLQLAREFIGTQDPLEFFRSWTTPNERYIPLAMRREPR